MCGGGRGGGGKERGDRENNSVGSSSSENNNCNRLSQETEVEYDGGCDQNTKERGLCGSVCVYVVVVCSV